MVTNWEIMKGMNTKWTECLQLAQSLVYVNLSCSICFRLISIPYTTHLLIIRVAAEEKVISIVR